MKNKFLIVYEILSVGEKSSDSFSHPEDKNINKKSLRIKLFYPQAVQLLLNKSTSAPLSSSSFQFFFSFVVLIGRKKKKTKIHLARHGGK